MVFVKFLEKNCRKGRFSSSKLKGKRVIELGAGCGVAGFGKFVNWNPRASFCMDSIEDIFESSLNLEGTHYKEGYDEGHADGLISGKQEGQQVGLKIGFEVGEELGFYRGCVDVWNSAIRVDPNCISARIQKTIKQMDELLQKYSIAEPENESVSDMMDSLRLKFRAICASLNVKLDYHGYPKASDAGNIEF